MRVDVDLWRRFGERRGRPGWEGAQVAFGGLGAVSADGRFLCRRVAASGVRRERRADVCGGSRAAR